MYDNGTKHCVCSGWVRHTKAAKMDVFFVIVIFLYARIDTSFSCWVEEGIFTRVAFCDDLVGIFFGLAYKRVFNCFCTLKYTIYKKLNGFVIMSLNNEWTME